MRSTDVLIVGGGIVGAQIAYQLTKRGHRNVTLVEARQLSAGGTGRSSGILRQLYLHPLPVAMAREGLQFYRAFSDVFGESAGFVHTGMIVGGNESHRERFEKGAALQRAIGASTDVIDARQVAERIPSMFTDDLTCALFEPEAGFADPSTACHTLASTAARAGAHIVQGVSVTGIRMTGETIQGVVTSEGDIATPMVVNAAGPWSARISAMAGVALPIKTIRHEVITLQRAPSMRRDQPIFSDAPNLVYTRLEGQGQFLVGSNAPTGSDELVDPDNCPDSARDDSMLDLAERAIRRFPELSDSPLSSGWSGVYDVTPDGFPIVDRVPEREGLIIAAGLSGHGFKLSYSIGRMVASLILDRDPDPSTRALRLGRFAAGEPIDSPQTTTLTSMVSPASRTLGQTGSG